MVKKKKLWLLVRHMGWWVGGFDRELTAGRGSMKEEGCGQFYKTCTIKVARLDFLGLIPPMFEH